MELWKAKVPLATIRKRLKMGESTLRKTLAFERPTWRHTCWAEDPAWKWSEIKQDQPGNFAGLEPAEEVPHPHRQVPQGEVV